MVGEWREVTVGELAPFAYGKGLTEGQRNSTGRVPVYGSNGVVGFHDASLTNGPTVVIGRKGTVGAVHYSAVPCWPIDTTFYVTGTDPLLVRYRYYLLKSLGLEHMNADSAVPGLNRDAAHARQIRVPSTETEQRAIAHILGTLDDKIELNRRRNQTLEAMARALFKDWFVDFGPVRAKMQLPSPSGRGDGGEGSNPRPRRKLPLPNAIRRHAAELRRNATDAENLLWRLLRNQQLAGAKFRRQHALPPYILDFYCHELTLAVELDGGQHNEPAGCAYDERRSAYLHAHGIEVLRFWNNDVLRDTEAVLEAIFQAIEAKRGKMPSPPAPLPEGEGSTARFGVEGERSAARFVAKAMATTTHHASADALKPFSPREKGWDEGAYLPRDLWDLFPDRLDDEGKPVGWEMAPLSAFASLVTTSVSPSKSPDTMFEHYSIPAFDAGRMPAMQLGKSIKSNKYIVDADAVLVSKLNPQTPRVWLPTVTTDRAVCSTEFMQFIPRDRKNRPYLYYLMSSQAMQEEVLKHVTGSTGSRQRAQPAQIAKVEAILPQPGALVVFNQQAAPILNAIAENRRESRTLAQLRDTLLPKLISGAIRVKDAQRIAGGCA